MTTDSIEEKKSKKVLQGTVVSDRMTKTIVVKVDRRVRHSQYLKFVTLSKKYKAHDEKEVASIGDRVEITECRPLSRHKRWALRKVLAKSSV